MPLSPKEKTCNRIKLLCGIFLLSFLGTGAYAVDTYVRQGDFLAQKAEKDYSRTMTVIGDRGQILDRNHNTLATNIDMVTVIADPKWVDKAQNTATVLAKALDLSPRKLGKELYGNKRYVRVATHVTREKALEIRKLRLKGIYFETHSKRFYPNREMASQIMGFTGRDGSGREGLEYKYNDLLMGKTQKLNRKTVGQGRFLDIDKKQKAELAGNSLVLTIDRQIQFMAEKALEKTVTEHRAKSGMALVLKPSTGELLAVAHYPSFNPNTEVDYGQGLWRNRAATDAFEPGSAMKVFTVAAALEKGLKPGSMFDCEDGKYKVGKYTIKDTHPRKWLKMSQVIQYSSNIGSAKIAETIGEKAMYHYLTRFGFGKKPESGSPGETAGTLAPYSQWSNIDLDVIAFGQGMAVSAIQLVSGMGALANDGILMKPMLIKKVVSKTGRDVKVYPPTTLGRVITSDTAEKVKAMMSLVVQDEGTGTKARMEGYPVCGKTGTAQKTQQGRKGYLKNRYVAVFAGFAPKKNPQLATLVVVDEPRNKYYGGDVAAPAFKSIMAQSFNYLNIPPEKPQPMVAALTKGEHQ